MNNAALDDLLERHASFWVRGQKAGPLLHVAPTHPGSGSRLRPLELPLAGDDVISAEHQVLTPEMIDPRLILDTDVFPSSTGAQTAEAPGIVGDLLVTRAPLARIPWVEAVLGCPVIPKRDAGSIYSAPYLAGPGHISAIPAPDKSAWLGLLLEYTRLLVEDSRGASQAVQCLQRGPTDLASALLGHSAMCMAIMDQPKDLHRLAQFCAEVFIDVAKAQEAIIPELNGGRCSPFGVWAPGTVVRTQCDMTASLSARMYEEVFFPYDREICRAFDYSVIHLHSGYLHTVDVFLKEDHPTAIQVSLDTGSTRHTVRDLIPLFARILEEKPLLIQGLMTTSELEDLLEQLPPQGLYISTETQDEP